MTTTATARIAVPEEEPAASTTEGTYYDPATGEVRPGGTTEPERTIRPFLAFLQEHREGALQDELSEALNRVVEAVRQIGKAGTLTFVVGIKPAGRSHNQVLIADDIKLKLPEPDREETVMYVDRDGNLTRANPKQMEMPGLKTVPTRAATIRTATQPTA